MSCIMKFFKELFQQESAQQPNKEYPTLKMINPDVVKVDFEAFRRNKGIQSQAKAASENFSARPKAQA